jgi:hypothetical protein
LQEQGERRMDFLHSSHQVRSVRIETLWRTLRAGRFYWRTAEPTACAEKFRQLVLRTRAQPRTRPRSVG